MATTQDIIKGALRRIVSYQSGEPIEAPDANDCLDTLNDLLDSWSIDKELIFGSVENVFQLIATKAQYTIGNPTNTELGEPPFTGFLTGGLPTITSVFNLPADFGPGATLTDLANVIPTGTTVLSIDPIGQIVTMSANATATPANNPDTITYTVPGDFPIARPNRITNGFTRFNQLDFTLEVTMSQSRFLEILYKAQPGPWPTVAWYNPQMPYGLLNLYQTPGNNADLHLFTDTILQNLTLTQTVILPSGYIRALKWCLAKEICAEYGFPLTEAIKMHAAESLSMIKALNALPAGVAKYDRMLVRGNRANAGFILDGGYG
jgi:hypothetical protein